MAATSRKIERKKTWGEAFRRRQHHAWWGRNGERAPLTYPVHSDKPTVSESGMFEEDAPHLCDASKRQASSGALNNPPLIYLHLYLCHCSSPLPQETVSSSQVSLLPATATHSSPQGEAGLIPTNAIWVMCPKPAPQWLLKGLAMKPQIQALPRLNLCLLWPHRVQPEASLGSSADSCPFPWAHQAHPT